MESKRAAHKGGEVAVKARKDLEQKTRKKVVSHENYLNIPLIPFSQRAEGQGVGKY